MTKNAEYQRKRKILLRKNGLCLDCTRESKYFIYCVHCRIKRGKRKADARKAHSQI